MAAPAATTSTATAAVASTHEQSNRWDEWTAPGPPAPLRQSDIQPHPSHALHVANRRAGTRRNPQGSKPCHCFEVKNLDPAGHFMQRDVRASPNLGAISFRLLASRGIDGHLLHMLTLVTSVRSSTLE